jgi:hypothetical protein
MAKTPIDYEQVALSLQLERERHERRLDWVSVAILSVLTGLSIGIVFQSMHTETNNNPAAERAAAEASAWGKTFLTTLGGVAVGVLGRSRISLPKPIKATEPETPPEPPKP